MLTKHSFNETPSVMLEESAIEEVKSAKFWGFLIDNKLTGNNQINSNIGETDTGIFPLQNCIVIIQFKQNIML